MGVFGSGHEKLGKKRYVGESRAIGSAHMKEIFFRSRFEMKGAIEGEGCDKCTGEGCYCFSEK